MCIRKLNVVRVNRYTDTMQQGTRKISYALRLGKTSTSFMCSIRKLHNNFVAKDYTATQPLLQCVIRKVKACQK